MGVRWHRPVTAVLMIVLIVFMWALPSSAQVFYSTESVLRDRFNTSMELPLPALPIDRQKISVSGISSGGFMAHQFHIAHSGHLEGAGIVAGGPFECTVDGDPASPASQASVWKGMFECTAFMRVSCKPPEGGLTESVCQFAVDAGPLALIIPERFRNAPDFFAGPGSRGQDAVAAAKASSDMAAASVTRATLRSTAGQIDPIAADSGLFKSKVYIIHSRQDNLLPRGVSDATYLTYRKLYQALGVPNWEQALANNVRYETAIPATHAILTNSYLKNAAPTVQTCTTFNLGGSFINDCQTGGCTEQACGGACTTEPPCDTASGVCSACTVPSCVAACDRAVAGGAASNAGSIFRQIHGDGIRQPCDPADPATSCPAGTTEGQPRDTAAAMWKNWNVARLYQFSQNHYVGDSFSDSSMAPEMSVANQAYLFVPKTCDPKSAQFRGAPCRLHVAFHGCLQGPALAGDSFNGKPPFVLYAGYTEWADANDVIVLFPQATRKSYPLLTGDFQHSNPQGCWNLWDYIPADNGLFATRGGAQIAMVARMVNALVGDPAFLKTAN